MRLHVTGAAGSGTTTLAAALAAELGIAHLDTDDFFWLPGDPPFTRYRPWRECLRLLNEAFAEAGSWVLSGYLAPWAAPLFPLFDFVVFLDVPTEVRLDRLRRRDGTGPLAHRYAPGGDLHDSFEKFLGWAAAYETAAGDRRSRANQEAIFSRLSCPLLRLEGNRPSDQLIRQCLDALAERDLPAKSDS